MPIYFLTNNGKTRQCVFNVFMQIYARIFTIPNCLPNYGSKLISSHTNLTKNCVQQFLHQLYQRIIKEFMQDFVQNLIRKLFQMFLLNYLRFFFIQKPLLKFHYKFFHKFVLILRVLRQILHKVLCKLIIECLLKSLMNITYCCPTELSQIRSICRLDELLI